MEAETGQQSQGQHAMQEPIAKEPRQTQKTMWLITYGASGPYITPAMLLELSNIEADECHSTKDRALNYTYMHLIKKVRQSTIEQFMFKAREAHGIVLSEIFGYEAITGNPKQRKDTALIQHHPGFQVLVKHYVTANQAFTPSTDGAPVISRGLILKAMESDPDQLTQLESRKKEQIIAYTRKLEEKLREYKKMERELHSLNAIYAAVSDERSALRIENADLKRKIDELSQGTA